ncbi:MAG: hypothetical protein ABEJ65_03130 [bacterium]
MTTVTAEVEQFREIEDGKKVVDLQILTGPVPPSITLPVGLVPDHTGTGEHVNIEIEELGKIMSEQEAVDRIQNLINSCAELLERAADAAASDLNSEAVRSPLRQANHKLMKASEQLGNVRETER